MLRKIGNWAEDYLYAIHRHAHAFIYRNPPRHFLGHVVREKNPIILIPGVYETWHFLQASVDDLSLRGHPVFVLEHIGYNTKEISYTAQLIRELIEEKDLYNIVIIAHSKGGLIGKYLLVFKNKDQRIRKLITIATPFGGTNLAKFIPYRLAKEFHPHGEIISMLHKESSVNHKIVSVYGTFDNHIWPTKNCYLEGAKNIQVNIHGHHKILFDKRVHKIVLEEVET